MNFLHFCNTIEKKLNSFVITFILILFLRREITEKLIYERKNMTFFCCSCVKLINFVLQIFI